jgi:mono/diheme cytochrome c family protein
VLLVAVAASPAQAVGPKSDPAKGQVLAARLCSNCHDVGAGPAANAKVEPPSFKSIANRPGQTPEGLAGKIIIPHPEMPVIPVTLPEIRDLVSYIVSLRD